MTESQDGLRSDHWKEDYHDKIKDVKEYLSYIKTPHVARPDSDALNHFTNPVYITARDKSYCYQESKTIYPLP